MRVDKENLIEVNNLSRHYKRGSEIVKALDDVTLSIKKGEMVSILGPSGSGKTTLINLISCLDVPTSGTLFINGKSVLGKSEEDLVEIRRGMLGFVFQQFHLLPTLTVAENVELPLLFLGQKSNRDRTLKILETVDLSDRAEHLPSELSGGQMQRVAIARSLIVNPKILIADEPTGNLDKAGGEAIFKLFRKLVIEEGLTVVVTTHNLTLGYQSDRIITLEDGRIIKEEKTSFSD